MLDAQTVQMSFIFILVIIRKLRSDFMTSTAVDVSRKRKQTKQAFCFKWVERDLSAASYSNSVFDSRLTLEQRDVDTLSRVSTTTLQHQHFNGISNFNTDIDFKRISLKNVNRSYRQIEFFFKSAKITNVSVDNWSMTIFFQLFLLELLNMFAFIQSTILGTARSCGSAHA